MFIGNSLIDSLPVSFSKISQKGYLEGLCDKLVQKHQDELKSAPENPVFYIDHVPSSMNPPIQSKKKK